MSSLTIVTPTLNQGDYIERTIRSVVPQLRPGDQYVVVDGGSTDGTHQILERWRDRISAVYIEPGSSQAEALALGFTRHPATYACYLNSDDLFMPGAVQRALSALDAAPPSVLGVYSHRLFIDSSDQLCRYWVLPPHSNYLMSRWDYIPQETCFWRYASMAACGGINAALRFAVDYDLFVRLMQAGTLRRLNDYLGCFREHVHSKTQTVNDSIGVHEVAQIKQTLGVKHHFYDRAIGFALRHVVQYRSRERMRAVADRQLLQQLIDQAAGKGSAAAGPGPR